MPRLSLPNRVTVTRVLLIVPFVVLLFYQNKPDWVYWARYGALAIFAIMAISDGVDGYLARKTGQRSRLGYFLDPLADKLLITTACILLAIKSTSVPGARLPAWVVVVIIGKDVLWLAGVLIIQFSIGHLSIPPSKLGRASTCAQLVMVTAILIYPDIVRLSLDFGWWMTNILWWSAAGLAVLTLADYTRMGASLWGESQNHNNRSPDA